MTPQVSLIASAVRPKLWEAFFKSLDGTSVEYEVVFAGNGFDKIEWEKDKKKPGLEEKEGDLVAWKINLTILGEE